VNCCAVRQGDKYGEDYVRMLRAMVREHCGTDLICLGDDAPLRYGFKGWWAKIELFAPENEFLRPCLYFDLDTYLLDDCRDMLVEPDGLWLIRDLGHPRRSNSGVMLIPKDTGAIWNAAKTWRGELVDGDFLNLQPHRQLQSRFDGIVSYKLDARHEPKGRVVCFHGEPKPHQADGWAGDVWRLRML